MPFDSISPNIITYREYRKYPGLQGTGFFVIRPPYEYIFYVTARHSVENVIDESNNCCLQVPIFLDKQKAVPFSFCLGCNMDNNFYSEKEDIAVWVIDNAKLSIQESLWLKKRALKLRDQITVKNLLTLGVKKKIRVKAIGFPIHNNPDGKTFIDHEKQTMVLQPRGFHGILNNDELFPNQYIITDTNWSGDSYNGFSGSPVIHLEYDFNGQVDRIPIGVIVRAGNKIARFVNINKVTNLIENFIINTVSG